MRVAGSMVAGLVLFCGGEARAGDCVGCAPESDGPIRGVEAALYGGAGYDTMGYARTTGLFVGRYFPSDDISLGLEGGLSINMDDELPKEERWDEDRLSFAAQVSWIFMGGPLADGGTPAYDTHLIGAIGMVSSQPVPLAQGEGVRVELEATAALGVGVRLSFTRWLSLLAEARDDVWIGNETRQIGVGRIGLGASMPVNR